MNEKAIDKMMFDFVSLLYKWLGVKRILAILAKLEEERGAINRATEMYWDAKHNARLLQSTADSLRE